jgi:hypothetical protein
VGKGQVKDMLKLNKGMMEIAMANTKKQNNLEDKIAMEWYGCTWDELDYDDKESVTNEALDRMGK